MNSALFEIIENLKIGGLNMTDINGVEILIGSKVSDIDNNKYSIIEKNGELHAKSLFNDCGSGEYVLYQERVNRNKFKVIG